jgi:tetratricopeptide (TPR) repeat protein
MIVEQLEEHLQRNPASPLFARRADQLFRAKRFDEALHACLDGIQRYPDYATAHLLAARCYAQKGEYGEAVRHVEIALKAVPGNGILMAFRKNWKDLSRLLKERPAAKPSANVESPVRKSVPTGRAESVTRESRSVEEAVTDSPIVSVTLAEIYETQGAYDAAIAMYRKLQQHKPKQAEQFEGKIRELREKLRQKPAD